MGIRFKCEACSKRLNVKEFLAGKRAICPKCGARIRIPPESTIARSSQRRSRKDSTKRPRVTSAPLGPGSPPGRQSVPQQAGGPVEASLAAAPSPISSGSIPPAMGAAADRPAEGAAVDPFAAAPLARWYVRPVAGGQYGPAPATVMRQWIGEGRVPGDALVWCEGWPAWKTAADVFAGLRPAAAASTALQSTLQPSAPSPAVMASAAPSGGAGFPPGSQPAAVEVALLPRLPGIAAASAQTAVPTGRRRGRNTGILATLLLLLAAVVLFPVLIYVLSKQTPPGGEPPNAAGGTSASVTYRW